MFDFLGSLLGWPFVVGGITLGIVGALIVERFYPDAQLVQLCVFLFGFASGLGIELAQTPKVKK